MDESRFAFINVMEILLKQAQNNKNVLEDKEINNAFKGMELTPEDFEWILDYFEKVDVDVLNTKDESEDDYDYMDDSIEKMEIINNTDILEDPVRM